MFFRMNTLKGPMVKLLPVLAMFWFKARGRGCRVCGERAMLAGLLSILDRGEALMARRVVMRTGKTVGLSNRMVNM